MKYANYKNSRNLAWQMLIDEKICKLPISVSSICKSLGISLKYYYPRDENDGKCMIIDGVPTIFVNENSTKQRQRFTAAHELGHLLHDHVGKYKLVNREPSLKDNPIEQEANVFASRLLAPACVLWGCNARSAYDIAELCDISLQFAHYRMERMEILYKRNKFLLSPLERAVYNQFREYISKHKL